MQSEEISKHLIEVPDYIIDEEEYNKVKSSIAEHKLFHPITITKTENGRYKILAGRTRFKALIELGYENIPSCVVNDITDLKAREIALHENLRRQNLPWYLQVEMESQLHNLRIEQHGKKKTTDYKGKNDSGWTLQKTADELGLALGTLAQDLDLARAVKSNPSLSKVKDKTTALKLIKVEARRSEDQAFSLIPPEIEMNQVFLGDSLSILKQFPPLIFDACITDPPWSDYARDESLTAEAQDLIPIFKEVYRVLKNDSFLYLICSSPDFASYSTLLPNLGFTLQPYPLIWQKNRTITHGRRNWQYARDYEPILLAVKGNPVLTSSTEISSILKYENLHYTKMIHPHEKSIELMKQIIGDSTYTGGKVLDCFAGSGVTLDAAKQMSRYYIGIEKNKEFYDKIIKRLSGGNEK